MKGNVDLDGRTGEDHMGDKRRKPGEWLQEAVRDAVGALGSAGRYVSNFFVELG